MYLLILDNEPQTFLFKIYFYMKSCSYIYKKRLEMNTTYSYAILHVFSEVLCSGKIFFLLGNGFSHGSSRNSAVLSHFLLA